jgi:lipid-A-disaccharide synthase
MVKGKFKIMLVAGEASGDAHAAKLVRALRETAPESDFEFFGAVSHRMRSENVEEIVNADDFSVVGLPEIARALPMFWRGFQKLKRAARKRKPDAVVLVDFPDFNLKLAKALKREGLKIIYYISPQLWAWRGYRIGIIENYVDLLLAILPFEKDWFARRGVRHVEFVGNPTVREIFSSLTKEQFCEKHDLNAEKPIIALLAGSRHKEIARILPALLETAALMEESDADLQFVVALAPTRRFVEVERAQAQAQKSPANLRVVQNETHEALRAADAAAVTSGTATLETAIIGTPMAIVYKTSPFNYKLLRPLISVEHFGLVNLIADERVAAELIQADFMPETLSRELFRLLDPQENRQMREKLQAVTDKLGRGGASQRAAELILNVIK